MTGLIKNDRQQDGEFGRANRKQEYKENRRM